MTYLVDIEAASNCFAEQDKQMHALLEQARAAPNPVSTPTPKIPSLYFPTLVRSIVSQQISTKAAASVFARVEALGSLTPSKIEQTDAATLAACGLSRQKVRYIHALAEAWPALESERFSEMPDAEVIKRLTACYGIGVWTTEMFLLFALARADIFALGDLGLRQQVAASYGVAADDLTAIREISERWSPHRSVASLTLWFALDNGPVLL